MFSEVLAQERAKQPLTKTPKTTSKILATMAAVGDPGILLEKSSNLKLGKESLTEKEYALLQQTLKSIRTTTHQTG
ncbi:hypothetical protein QTG56_23985 (plasmid) [Rossellomorea sp. AcN35-11]|nr:hypothetical protein [Rossellomorea aquimaris]WJV31699.1 hypothetical protein QTG56_23985 [Rossellomorea sp. AcN35-11]